MYKVRIDQSHGGELSMGGHSLVDINIKTVQSEVEVAKQLTTSQPSIHKVSLLHETKNLSVFDNALKKFITLMILL